MPLFFPSEGGGCLGGDGEGILIFNRENIDSQDGINEEVGMFEIRGMTSGMGFLGVG